MSHTFRFIGSKIDGVWKVDKGELHHMNVLRLKTEDVIELTDGKGSLCTARIIDINSSSIKLEELNSRTISKDNPSVILVIALLKNMDDLLPMITEIGVDKIFIFQQQHNKKDLTDKNKERFSNIIRSSVKQCKRDFIPEIRFFSSLKDCLDYINKDQTDKSASYKKILLDETSSNLLLNLDIDMGSFKKDSSVVIIIGSELGFYEEESKILEEYDLEKYSLGDNILRSITACLCSCMLVKLKIKEYLNRS